jgi:hypothetical protein
MGKRIELPLTYRAGKLHGGDAGIEAGGPSKRSRSAALENSSIESAPTPRLTLDAITAAALPLGKMMRDTKMSKPNALLNRIGSAEAILAHKRAQKAAQMRLYRARLKLKNVK